MGKKWNIVIRCSAFCLVFVLLFTQFTRMYQRRDDETNEIHAFYGEPEDSLDVLYIGSSPLLRGISPMQMYREHGYTGYVRASALQAPAVSYGLLGESLQKQSPKVVVLVCDNLFQEYDYAEHEGDLRRALDGMKLSPYKWEIMQKVTAADERQTMLSYLFPLLRYHERWKEVNLAEAEAEPLLKHSFQKGQVPLSDVAPQTYPSDFMKPTGENVVFDEDALLETMRSIALCKKKEIPVLLLHLPKMNWSYEKSMAIEQFAKEQGVDYVDLDREEVRNVLELNPQMDYYDQGHMNVTGAKKVSKWLGDFLAEKYALPDHRNDDSYLQWDADLKVYLEKIDAMEKQNSKVAK